MKKGLNAWAFPSDMPMEKRMKIAKDAGFSGFEVLFESDGYVGMTSTDAELMEVRKYAQDLGIEIPSICGTHYEGTMLSLDDGCGSAEFIEKFKRMLHAAAVIGADTALLVPGRVNNERPDGSYERAFENASKNLRKLAECAETEGVYVGVENVWNKFLLSPLEMRDFIDSAGSKYIQAYFDVGNIMYIGYPEQWIRILGSRIKKVHIKDFSVIKSGVGVFTDLLEGSIDFKAVMKAFKDVGYDDYITAEVGPFASVPDLKAYIASLAMDRIFKM